MPTALADVASLSIKVMYRLNRCREVRPTCFGSVDAARHCLIKGYMSDATNVSRRELRPGGTEERR